MDTFDAPPCHAPSPSREPLHALLERVSDAVFALDASWRFTYANQRAAEWLQQRASALLGQELWSACPEVANSVFEHEYRRAMAQQCAVRFETLVPSLGLWVEVDAYPAADGLSVFWRDISRRKQAEAELRDREARHETAAAGRAEEARFRAFVEHVQDIISVVSPDGTIRYESPAITQVLGYGAEELIGRHAAEVLHPEDIGYIMEELSQLCAVPGGKTEVTYRCQHKDGSWRTLEAKAWNQLHAPAIDGVVLSARDVTQRSLAEVALRESEERFRALNRSTPVGIFQSDNHGQITYANPRAQQLWHATEDEILGIGWTRRVHSEDLPALLDGWRAALSTQSEHETDFRLQLDDGSIRYMRGRSAPLRNAAGVVTGSVGTIWDITERKELEAELIRGAYHDALTQLENRKRFRERVEAVLAKLDACEQPLPPPAVLFVDLDDFKTVNDSLGHEFGDRLLVQVAERLQSAIRATDTVARLGGDEFAVLIEKDCNAEAASQIAERIVSLLGEPFELDGHKVRVGASVGIALASPGHTPDDVLRNADLAMYRAKHGGKRRHEIFVPEMHAAALDRLTLADELYRALEAQEFLLHYQPVVELSTKRIVGAEALVRWRHPTRGLVPPGTFIPIAEETGFIVPLGRWVLFEACRNAMKWPRPSGTPLLLSVNVSARQLREPGFLDEVRQALRESGLPPGALVLEITESVLMHDRDAMPERLQELKALGVQIAVDDFGTGFSSLAYLKKFPVDVIKIDKSFVDAVGQGGKELALTRTIINLAESLGLRSIAEGVEDAGQHAQLQLLGCLLGQGYLFARPMLAQALAVLLQSPVQHSEAQETPRGQ